MGAKDVEGEEEGASEVLFDWMNELKSNVSSTAEGGWWIGIVSIGADWVVCVTRGWRPPRFDTATTCLRRFSKIETRCVNALFWDTSFSISE